VELFFGNQKCIKALETKKVGDEIIVVTQSNPGVGYPEPGDLYGIGVMGIVTQIQPAGEKLKVIFQASSRVKINKYIKTEPYFLIRFEQIKNASNLDETGIVLKNTLINNIKILVNNNKSLPLELAIKLLSLDDPNKIIDNLVPLIEEKIPLKQEILETIDINKRLELTNSLVYRAMQVSELEQKVAEKTQEEFSKAQKEVFLREELKTIKKELGEGEVNEFEEIRKKIKAAQMPPAVETVALKELAHLEKTPSFSPEVSFIRNYLDWLVSMPWDRYSISTINLREAKEILNNDHFGLDRIKERVLEFLAVQKLVGKIKGPILCFVGPPGTGKTSIGKSIAKALNRKFTRISLGGIRDEAEIRGHRRTYVGAMPGRIIQAIHTADEKNPVFMLDEIDKIGTDFRGDPSSALLEALDPEQNFNFSDHYLEVPFDLSDVVFITTANILDTIPAPLRDRMEIIEFPGYTQEEKFNIAKEFIWPKVLHSHGLADRNIALDDNTIKEIIDSYTLEAGVRNLEREMEKIARKIAVMIANGRSKGEMVIKSKDLYNLLGHTKVDKWLKENEDEIGVVAALAVTEAGGEILSVEAAFIPGGKGNLTLTGHLGDVMKESALAALSYARAKSEVYNIDPKTFTTHDIHVHVPRGAIPKDGPSAGAAISGAIVSALTKAPVDLNVGMTGEITLRGQVLKIGGLKEKVLAARRAGLKTVIIPDTNKNELEDIPAEYKKEMEFIYAKSMDDILPVLMPDLKK